MNKKHYIQIDSLKGFAIFLVILGHSIIVYPINLHENYICSFLYSWISSVHMPLFFVISGFCFSYNNQYKSYILKKMKRILFPYVIFSIFDLIPRIIFPNLVNSSRNCTESIMEILFYGGEYWFLYTLFIIFVLYPIINNFFNKSKLNQILLTILLIFIKLLTPNIKIFMFSNVINYLIFFNFGVLIKKHFQNSIFCNNKNKFIHCICIIILCTIWITILRYNNNMMYFFIALVGIVTIYMCTNFDNFNSFFSVLGKYSLQLYLLNGFFLVISRTLIVSVLQVSNPLTIIIFNMIIDLYVSYLIIKYICAKNKFLRIVMGII